MAKLANEMFEGINVNVGVVTLRFKNPIKSLASIARRPSRVNDQGVKAPLFRCK